MSGVRKSLTSELTTAVNAAPMTTPVARSMTLPRRMNLRNPDSRNVSRLRSRNLSISLIARVSISVGEGMSLDRHRRFGAALARRDDERDADEQQHESRDGGSVRALMQPHSSDRRRTRHLEQDRERHHRRTDPAQHPVEQRVTEELRTCG